MFDSLRQQYDKVSGKAEVKVCYSPPQDGSYPPRLVMLNEDCPYTLKPYKGRLFSYSLWLKNRERTPVISGEIEIECGEDGTCTLIPLNSMMSEVRINGQPLTRRQQLVDGDFIHWREWRAIFQADPVKDRRVRMEANPQNLAQQVIPIKRKLAKWVVVNGDGISFNGGVDFARWDELDFLSFSDELQVRRHGYDVYLKQNKKSKPLKKRLGYLEHKDIEALTDWIWLSLPFDLCVNVFAIQSSLREFFPDAYQVAAFEKLSPSSMDNPRVPLVDRNFILGIQSARRRVWNMRGDILSGLLFIVLMATLGAANGATNDKNPVPFIDTWLSIFVGMAGTSGVLAIFIFLAIQHQNIINKFGKVKQKYMPKNDNHSAKDR